MNWFRKRPPAQVRVIHSSAMRLSTWRNSPDLVRYAMQLLASPQFQTMLAVLRNESPQNLGLPTLGATHDDHIGHAYRGEGYNMALNTIEAMGQPLVVDEPLQATWQREEPLDDQQLPEKSA